MGGASTLMGSCERRSGSGRRTLHACTRSHTAAAQTTRRRTLPQVVVVDEFLGRDDAHRVIREAMVRVRPPTLGACGHVCVWQGRQRVGGLWPLLAAEGGCESLRRRRLCVTCAVLCCAVLCCAVLCCAVLCYSALLQASYQDQFVPKLARH